MTTTTTLYDLASRESRYAIQSGRTVPVVIKRTTSETAQTIVGELINLSRGGAKLTVQQCVPFSETIEIAIDLVDADVQLVLTAEVCWTRPAEDDSWQLGCSFGAPLPEEVMTKLAAAAYLERRKSERQLTSIVATARSELGGTGARVEISNFSAGGFCLRRAGSETTGDHILVEFKRPNESRATIHARVQWRLKIGRDCLLGCSFVNGNDVNYLYEMANEVDAKWPTDAATDESARTKPSAPWKATAAIFVGVVCAGLLYVVTLWSLPTDKPIQQSRMASVDRPAASHDEPDHTRTRTPAPTATLDSNGGGVKPASNRRSFGNNDGKRVRQNVDAAPSADDLDLDFSALEVATLPESTVSDHGPETISQTPDEPVAAQIETTTRAADELEIEQPDASDLVVPSVDLRPVADAVYRLLTAVQSRAPQPTVDLPDSQQSVDPRPSQPSVDSQAYQQPIDTQSSQQPSTQETEPVVEQDSLDPIVATESVAASQFEPEEDTEAEQEPEPEPSVVLDPKAAIAAFVQGQDYYRRRQFSHAVDAFLTAANNDPENPLYRYFLALSQFELGKNAEAQQSAEAAARLERLRPISNWGTTLQRYQGAARIWLENTRRKLMSPAKAYSVSSRA